ncbi:MAG: hypothetical protein M1561_04890 [Gammaproteobacteria bacterium]|nr:hypothetical protein [Gammaproteobacteria bacterium]
MSASLAQLTIINQSTGASSSASALDEHSTNSIIPLVGSAGSIQQPPTVILLTSDEMKEIKAIKAQAKALMADADYSNKRVKICSGAKNGLYASLELMCTLEIVAFLGGGGPYAIACGIVSGGIVGISTGYGMYLADISDANQVHARCVRRNQQIQDDKLSPMVDTKDAYEVKAKAALCSSRSFSLTEGVNLMLSLFTFGASPMLPLNDTTMMAAGLPTSAGVFIASLGCSYFLHREEEDSKGLLGLKHRYRDILVTAAGRQLAPQLSSADTGQLKQNLLKQLGLTRDKPPEGISDEEKEKIIQFLDAIEKDSTPQFANLLYCIVAGHATSLGIVAVCKQLGFYPWFAASIGGFLFAGLNFASNYTALSQESKALEAKVCANLGVERKADTAESECGFSWFCKRLFSLVSTAGNLLIDNGLVPIFGLVMSLLTNAIFVGDNRMYAYILGAVEGIILAGSQEGMSVRARDLHATLQLIKAMQDEKEVIRPRYARDAEAKLSRADAESGAGQEAAREPTAPIGFELLQVLRHRRPHADQAPKRDQVDVTVEAPNSSSTLHTPLLSAV